MRWERLFADLEGQLDAVADVALDAAVADRTRSEFAATTLEGRLRAAAGRSIELSVAGAGLIRGEARRVGPGWVMLDVRGGLPAIVATPCVSGSRDLPVASRESVSPEGETSRGGLAGVLRVLARDRTVTAVVLVDGATITGTIDRVGTDYLDLAEHSADEPRRSSLIKGVRTIALSAVAVLRPRLE